MIELELFYKTTTDAIRSAQADYLKKQRSEPFAQDLPEVKEASAEELVKMGFIARMRYEYYLRRARKRYKKALKRQKYPVDELLTKGYNAGMERALRVLEREFEAFKKKIEREEN